MKIISLLFISAIALNPLQTLAAETTQQKTKPAATAKKSDVSITDIEIGIFDRLTAKIVKVGEASDPYGNFSDVFVKVKIKNTKLPAANDELLTVRLTATTDETEDEARGIMEATHQALKQTTFLNYEAEITTVPFLVEFHCNPMTFTVEILELHIKKSITQGVGCAE